MHLKEINPALFQSDLSGIFQDGEWENAMALGRKAEREPAHQNGDNIETALSEVSKACKSVMREGDWWRAHITAETFSIRDSLRLEQAKAHQSVGGGFFMEIDFSVLNYWIKEAPVFLNGKKVSPLRGLREFFVSKPLRL